MAKIIGLSRNLKLQWLNKTVELVSTGLTEQEIKENLNEYLGFEIKSPTNIRKTREILMNIWVYENEKSNKIKASALKMIRLYPEYSLVVHWCMIMATYPVFLDMCRLISKISEFQDEIVLSQLKQKLFEEWGERTTLYHSIDKLISTFKAFDVVTCNKPGKYIVKMHKINNSEIVSFMIYTSFIVKDENGYYSLEEIKNSTYYFPFEYMIDKAVLFEDKRFSANNFGGEITFSLNS